MTFYYVLYCVDDQLDQNMQCLKSRKDGCTGTVRSVNANLELCVEVLTKTASVLCLLSVHFNEMLNKEFS